jgi:hypothetical protein
MTHIQHMKEALRAGTIVVSPRCSGKTEALVEIYHEDRDAAVIFAVEAQYRRFVDLYEKKYGKQPDKRFLMLGGFKSKEPEDVARMATKKLYIDELYISRFVGPFHAAVTSFPMPVVVMMPQQSEAV